MKSLLRIEKSAFRRGEYVGYCQGAQRVIRDGAVWRTAGLCSSAGNPVVASARTLAQLDDKLATLADPAVRVPHSYRDAQS